MGYVINSFVAFFEKLIRMRNKAPQKEGVFFFFINGKINHLLCRCVPKQL